GVELPSAARSALIMRPFDQELMACQRYYETISFGTSMAQMFNSYAMMGTQFNYCPPWHFHVKKRIAPTLALLAGAHWNSTVPTVTNVSVDSVFFQHDTASFFLIGTAGALAM